ncbi:uncharacterized protein LOC116164091 [Photinus pyralis]|uniref:uncharacterized protein LOC116164091 n=2 Tax=Photinus pyralis TaxID=7054 RepID=UPI0012675F53|nr:uncharacterized protein LOC116164091 [Photinus pyralis]
MGAACALQQGAEAGLYREQRLHLTAEQLQQIGQQDASQWGQHIKAELRRIAWVYLRNCPSEKVDQYCAAKLLGSSCERATCLRCGVKKANIITYNKNHCLLESIKQNIISNRPRIELCRSFGCDPTSGQEPSSNNLVTFTTQPICTDLEVPTPPDSEITAEWNPEANHFGDNEWSTIEMIIRDIEDNAPAPIATTTAHRFSDNQLVPSTVQLADKAVLEGQMVPDTNLFEFDNGTNKDPNTDNIEYYVVEENTIDIDHNESFSFTSQPLDRPCLEQIVPHSDVFNEFDTSTSEDQNVSFFVITDHSYTRTCIRDNKESYHVAPTTNGDCVPASSRRSIPFAVQPLYEMSLEAPIELDSETFEILDVDTFQDVAIENEQYVKEEMKFM